MNGCNVPPRVVVVVVIVVVVVVVPIRMTLLALSTISLKAVEGFINTYLIDGTCIDGSSVF